MNYNVKLSDEVREAIALGRPVIALESTIIAHGMPYPQNVKTALACERLARTHGAVPATIAIIGGQLCAGLTEEQIEYLGREGRNVAKVSAAIFLISWQRVRTAQRRLPQRCSLQALRA